MRRRRKSPLADALFKLSRSATRAAKSATRKTTRATTTAISRQATKAAQQTRDALSGIASPAKAPVTRKGSGRWLEGRWGLGPMTMRRYRLYLPPGAGKRRPAPLLLFLHGCQQDTASFAASTRIASFARQKGLAVLMPEQPQEANPQRCWNWFGNEHLVALEARILMSIVDHVGNTEPVKANTLFAMGLSAGGAMSMTLALRYPDRFRAVASHSGAVASSARNLLQAGQAMRGRRAPDVDVIYRQLAGHTAPPLLLIHGDRDPVVNPGSAEAAAALWLALCDEDDAIRALPPRESARGERYPTTRFDWKRNGRPYLRMVQVSGLGHAWSGGTAKRMYSDPKGPDALRLAWGWFGLQMKCVGP